MIDVRRGGKLLSKSVCRAACSILALLSYLIVTPVYSLDNTIDALKKDFLKGYKLTQSGNSSEAARSLAKIRDLKAAMRDYILFYLGKSFHEEKKCPDAKAVFQELMENYPESRWASVAETQASSDEECPPLALPSVEVPAVDCESMQDKEDRADCYFNSRQYRRAKDLYKDLCASPSIRCLTHLSQAAARSQDFETAIAANESFIKHYPRSKVSEEARRKIAFLLEDSGNFKAALTALGDLVSHSRAKEERRQYRERIAWCHFRLGRFKEAEKSFDAALDEAETPFSLYWKGRVLEKLGRSKESNEVYRNLAAQYGGNYYGLRALERLGSSEGKPLADLPHFHPGFDWLKSSESLEPSPDLERIHELTAIGLISDAAIEARRYRLKEGIRLPSDPRRLLKDKNGAFVFEQKTPKDESADYPLPYADTLFDQVEQSKPHPIDPYLVYAMMRQESRYKESIVSPVGAIGLLQIMPATGRKLALEDGWPDYQPKWLYDPATNIELGVQYIQNLWGLLDGHWYAVVASYNAGEQVVAEWLKQRKGLSEEEFIEEIPYKETRDYVKRVYSYWRAYRSAYEVN